MFHKLRRRAAAMPRLITLTTVAATTLVGLAAAAMPAQAKVPGPDGQLVFGRYRASLGDFQIFTANPDGTSQTQLLPGVAQCPRWSPTGTRILVCRADSGGLIRPATLRPDGSGFRLLDNPDPTLNVACWAWSAAGTRLACEGWDDADLARPAGVFTVRSSDGRDLVRVTTNPFGAHDIPGDYSPDGRKIVFLRDANANTETGALFVVNTDGSGLRKITDQNVAEDSGSWSPDGKWILFSSGKGKLSVVHPDGSGLRQIRLDTGPGSYYASEPVWSPDGTHLALRLFLASTGEQHLYTVRATGSGLRRVANTQGGDEFPDWGPHQLAHPNSHAAPNLRGTPAP